ncbi:hypothetical protein IFM89_006909 [Coptis chinensis]|uniref:Protein DETOXIFICATION n=1 Tax=Coptis chinensis TaxID=261450 RepID=A0A835HCZ3_9MAGN|nr:hypothetical protein IFM89_006909 [Coptis chinensis]
MRSPVEHAARIRRSLDYWGNKCLAVFSNHLIALAIRGNKYLTCVLHIFSGLVMAESNLNLSEERKRMPARVFFQDASLVFKKDELGREIINIALPTALALLADPIASLIDTAFIGHIGWLFSLVFSNELLETLHFPALQYVRTTHAMYALVIQCVSVITEEETIVRVTDACESDNLEKGLSKDSETTKDLITESDSGKALQQSTSTSRNPKIANLKNEKKHIASASSALVIGGILGLLQAVFLILAAKPLLGFMGVKSGSPMLTPALQYLTLRSLGAPAILLSLAMQGIFRGLKDTKTPLFATVAGDITNIILDPIFIYVLHMGVRGAAIAHIISQYLISVLLLWRLMQKIVLLPPSLKTLQLGRFLKNGSLLLARVIAATICVTLAASFAARLGPIPMAAFQICLQIWLATSLLADGLAVAGQAIMASAFAEKDLKKATAAAVRVLQHGLVLGVVLALVLGVGMQFGSILFTKDKHVIHLISLTIPFVAATQPLNSLAFVFDGVNFGASDFTYSAYSMASLISLTEGAENLYVVVSIISTVSLFLLFHSHGYIGIWVALTIYMALRMIAGIWRMGTGTGPWRFLRN